MSAPLLLPYDEALERLLATIEPTGPESVPLDAALGRIAAEDVTAPIDLPPYTNSAMDGYACIAADTLESTESRPTVLRIVGASAAGHHPTASVGTGQAVAISTGAVMPHGADAIVMVEDTRQGASLSSVKVLLPAIRGQYVRSVGEDVRSGERIVSQGDRITPGRIALLAACGINRVLVARVPRVAIIATGSELAVPGTALELGQIYDSNSPMLAALIAQTGAQLVLRIGVADSVAQLREAFKQALRAEADIIIATGGVSVGAHDHVKQVVAEGGTLDFWRVAIRPGKPFAFGHISGRPIVGLPGNPASALVTFTLFVAPALRKMAGHLHESHHQLVATLAKPAEHEPGRQSYLRATCNWDIGKLIATPLIGQASHRLRSLADANALVILPADVERIDEGQSVRVILIAPDTAW